MNTSVVFPESAFVPIVLGFFGLATGYLIWGGSTLFGAKPEAAGNGEEQLGSGGCSVESGSCA